MRMEISHLTFPSPPLVLSPWRCGDHIVPLYVHIYICPIYRDIGGVYYAVVDTRHARYVRYVWYVWYVPEVPRHVHGLTSAGLNVYVCVRQRSILL